MQVLPDIPYGPTPHQCVDLFLPSAPTAMVAYLHGGGFVKGSRKESTVDALAAHLGPLGIAVAAVGYRLGGTMQQLAKPDRLAVRRMAAASAAAGLRLSPRLYGAAFAHAVLDAGEALAALKSGRCDTRLAGVPLVAMGMSAGGIAALSLAHPPRIWAARGARPDAVLAVSAAMVQPWRLQPEGPPCVMIHSAQDRIIPADDARLADRAAKAARADLTLRITDVRGHVPQLDWLMRGSLSDGRPALALLTDLVRGVLSGGSAKG